MWIRVLAHRWWNRCRARPRSMVLAVLGCILLGTSVVGKAAEGGITADLPYILQRWLHVPEGLTLFVDVSVGGELIGLGELAIDGLRWSQIMPQTNAEGTRLWVQSVWADWHVYVWNDLLGVGTIYPSCPSLLLLGQLFAVIPDGRELIAAAGGTWAESSSDGVCWPIPETALMIDDSNSLVTWRYTWPFRHDPEFTESLEVVVAYGQGQDGRFTYAPALQKAVWSEPMRAVRWYFHDWELRSYTNWRMQRGTMLSQFTLPDNVVWDVMPHCPDPDWPPPWWEWGLESAE